MHQLDCDKNSVLLQYQTKAFQMVTVMLKQKLDNDSSVADWLMLSWNTWYRTDEIIKSIFPTTFLCVVQIEFKRSKGGYVKHNTIRKSSHTEINEIKIYEISPDNPIPSRFIEMYVLFIWKYNWAVFIVFLLKQSSRSAISKLSVSAQLWSKDIFYTFIPPSSRTGLVLK